ncbi:hypothetical protein CC86DRAFT_366357 [Ophiobolus disseminans]|uniref:Uncharacterized protein n=1 Tax=Ophiobolus disseminans TaxID=1469910 RepID=A0A6A7AIW3_9PLEO|nr:hypothetical protein CC86DRAFT_366357 [Ophiobolus disseminans]
MSRKLSDDHTCICGITTSFLLTTWFTKTGVMSIAQGHSQDSAIDNCALLAQCADWLQSHCRLLLSACADMSGATLARSVFIPIAA